MGEIEGKGKNKTMRDGRGQRRRQGSMGRITRKARQENNVIKDGTEQAEDA